MGVESWYWKSIVYLWWTSKLIKNISQRIFSKLWHYERWRLKFLLSAFQSQKLWCETFCEIIETLLRWWNDFFVRHRSVKGAPPFLPIDSSLYGVACQNQGKYHWCGCYRLSRNYISYQQARVGHKLVLVFSLSRLDYRFSLISSKTPVKSRHIFLFSNKLRFIIFLKEAKHKISAPPFSKQSSNLSSKKLLYRGDGIRHRMTK